MRRAATQILVVITPMILGCVDQVKLALPVVTMPIVVEGRVTDQEGPDTVKIVRAYPVDGKFHPRVGITNAKIAINDDEGNYEVLKDIGRGYYVTETLEGVIGRTYTLSGILPDGTEFTSTPERMAPAGYIDALYYEFVISENSSTGARDAGFNIYADSQVESGSSLRMRWRFRGTYRYFTDPSLISDHPVPCAAGCQCCVCYAVEQEPAPILSDPRLVGARLFRRTFIQYIPVNGFTFNDKYRIEVEQMEISQPVYDFYFQIRHQIQNASSLFQPPFFELTGNLTADGASKVIGVFSAAAVTLKHIYISKRDVPVGVSTQPVAADCRVAVRGATTTPPPYWD